MVMLIKQTQNTKQIVPPANFQTYMIYEHISDKEVALAHCVANDFSDYYNMSFGVALSSNKGLGNQQ